MSVDRNETDMLYVLGTPMNTTAELPDSPRVLRTLQTQKPQFSVVNESLSKTASVPSAMLDVVHQPRASSAEHFHSSRKLSHAGNLGAATPQHSPGKKRSSIKRTSLVRKQSSAMNLSAAVTAHFRRKEDIPKLPASPEKSPKKGFRIGGTSTDLSSDDSQDLLVSRPGTVIQQRKVCGHTLRLQHG